VVGVEALLDGAGGHTEYPAPQGDLERLEIEGVSGARAYEGFDFVDDLGLEGAGEAPFLAGPWGSTAPAARRTSHKASLTSISARARVRKR
jgi:hypothetical protein